MNHKNILQWAMQSISAKYDTSVIHHECLIETAYSTVYKIETNKTVFYLKQTPIALFQETDMLEFLHQKKCQFIPMLLAKNDELSCFISISCGDISLRNLFKSNINSQFIKKGIANYTRIQRLLEKQVNSLLNLGRGDWQLEKFPSHFLKLLGHTDLLLSDGLTERELLQLKQAHSFCAELCQKLDAFQIPETLSHCDFHDNNLILDRKTGQVSIIDWGEVVVAHPFFSLNGCLWNLSYFHGLNESNQLYHDIRRQCIQPWFSLHEEDRLLEAFGIAHQLLGIYAALSYQQMYAATEDLEKTVQQQHSGSIAGCLRSFLSAINQ